MKQSIIVPKFVSESFFRLPVILGVRKIRVPNGKELRCFLLNAELLIDGFADKCWVIPGETLIQEDDGKWRIDS